MKKYLRPIIRNLKDGEGCTFKNGQPVRYKTGWQVGLEGYETTDRETALELVKKLKDCGIWLSKGVYYIDKSKRFNTKKEALAAGIAHNQQSIYGWTKGNLVWC